MLAFVPEKNTLTEDLRLINEIIAKAGGGGGAYETAVTKAPDDSLSNRFNVSNVSDLMNPCPKCKNRMIYAMIQISKVVFISFHK